MKNNSLEVPHVFVISHERSGTHIVIDAIRNNFPIYKINFYVNIDRMTEGHWSHCSQDLIKTELQKEPRVIKTHMLSDTGVFFDGGGVATQLVNSYVESSKLIYIYRDGRDVLGSLYSFWSRTVPGFGEITFSDMLKGDFTTNIGQARQGSVNPVLYWREHVQNWIEREDVLTLSFEEILNDYENTLLKISQFICLSPIKS